jgi:protein-L-isoaspartate(D-aspartate) O-methyltransferase
MLALTLAWSFVQMGARGDDGHAGRSMAATDSLVQRTNMVESQIRPSDVTDRRILRAMQSVAREAFVPKGFASLAYMDTDVPLGAPTAGRMGMGRTLMSPRLFAKLVQLAGVEPNMRVLIVGAGGGYGAAVLAQLAAHVVALEADEALLAAARTGLSACGNVTVMAGALPLGAAEQGPYDAVVVDGMIGVRPVGLLGQLKDGGRLVAFVRTGHIGQATRWQRVGAQFGETTAFDGLAGDLPGFGAQAAFVL